MELNQTMRDIWEVIHDLVEEQWMVVLGVCLSTAFCIGIFWWLGSLWMRRWSSGGSREEEVEEAKW